jgi:hypothetical protein
MSPSKVTETSVKHLIEAAVHNRFDHVEREAFRHLDGDLGRNGEFLSVHHRVDPHRAIMGGSGLDSRLHVGRVLKPNATDADRSTRAAKFGFLKSVAKPTNPLDSCSNSMKPSAPLLKTTTFTGRPSWARLRESPISIAKPPSPESEITCRLRKTDCAPIACATVFAIGQCQNEPMSPRLLFVAR